MKERLKKIRLTLGYTQQEMADKLGVSLRAYQTYEYVSKGYPSELIQNLIENCAVNANYFFTGRGVMFAGTDKKQPEKEDLLLERIQKMGSRLSELQKNNKCTDKEMSEIIGIFEYEYAELKEGSKELSLKILHRLKRNFDISIDWLLYGS